MRLRDASGLQHRNRVNDNAIATGVGVNQKDCPECAETVKAAANVCRYCGHRFLDHSEETIAKLPLSDRQRWAVAGQAARAGSPWRTPPNSASPQAGEKTNRIFADEGPGAKWGCLGAAALLVALAGGGVAFCNREYAESERIETEQMAAEKKEEAARHQDRVESGQVCADGPNDLNTALALSVKRSLKDPDSFEHIGTVIKPVGDGVNYDALMRYRARNSFNGYVVSTVLGKLYLSEPGVCEVRSYKVLQQ